MSTIRSHVLPPLALALAAAPALAQATVFDGPITALGGSSLALAADRILQTAEVGGTGSGAWLGPTHLELGSAQGALVDASGARAFELDASLTRYVFLGLGVEYGGLSGLLTPVGADASGATLIVEGEWVRLSGPVGELRALILEPTGGVPALRPIGAFTGRIAYEAWTEPDPRSGSAVSDLRGDARSDSPHDPSGSGAPAPGASSTAGSLQHAPTAVALGRDAASVSLPKATPVVSPGPSTTRSISHAPSRAALGRDAASAASPKVAPVAPGTRSGMQLGVERAGLASDLRPRAAASANAAYVRRDELPGDAGAAGPVDLRDAALADVVLTGTDIVIDTTRVGAFQLTYRMLR